MSWDVSVFAAKAPPLPVSEMPNDWRGEPLGTVAEVRDKISTTFPEVDWSDPTWGIYDGEGFSFEFNVGRENSSEGFMVHIRGNGKAVTAILQLAERWSWYILDTSQGEWLHHCSNAEAGWQEFEAYRNRVLNPPSRDGE